MYNVMFKHYAFLKLCLAHFLHYIQICANHFDELRARARVAKSAFVRGGGGVKG
jgi:hypothetical protein